MRWWRRLARWYLDRYNLVQPARSISGAAPPLPLLFDIGGVEPAPPPAPFFLPSTGKWLLQARRNGRR